MAKLKIKKIEIVADVRDCDKILKTLQRNGFVELCSPEDFEGGGTTDAFDSIEELSKRSRTAENALQILKKHGVKSGGLLSFLNEKKLLSDKEYDDLSSESDKIYEVARNIEDEQENISEAYVSIARLKTRIDYLRPWLNLDIPLNFKGTLNTSALIGSFPKKYDKTEILSFLAERNPLIESLDCEIVSSDDTETCAVLFCLKNDRNAVLESIKDLGFSEVSEPVALTPKEEEEQLKGEIESLEKSISESSKKIDSSISWYEKIEFLIDYYSIEKDRSEALKKVVHTQKLMLITGYIPEIKSEKLKNKVEEKYTAAVIIEEPSEDEDVPVMLKNNGFSEPCENITEMYSSPGKTDIDPTPIMSFFYYFFFGMMLSDAGYGLIIVIAILFVLIKFKPEKKMRNTLKMYLYCGISTVFWGAMYGSWFGDMPNVIGSNFFNTDKFASTAIWIDPLNDLMELLVYCFIFGLVHLFTGVAIKSVNLFRHNKKFDAFCEFVPTAVTIYGFCPIFFGMFTEIPDWLRTTGTPALIVGVILVILTAGRDSKSVIGKFGSGLYGLYNLVSGYLGDVLSYARLLALGLSTGVIAQVVNMLCMLPSNKTLKIIMLIVVGLIGHTANLAINLIGAYVHTNRLQYVEFFGKFYEGGGRALAPFGINTKTYKLKEEN